MKIIDALNMGRGYKEIGLRYVFGSKCKNEACSYFVSSKGVYYFRYCLDEKVEWTLIGKELPICRTF
jgi:hypothetical protein